MSGLAEPSIKVLKAELLRRLDEFNETELSPHLRELEELRRRGLPEKEVVPYGEFLKEREMQTLLEEVYGKDGKGKTQRKLYQYKFSERNRSIANEGFAGLEEFWKLPY